ncbi:MAG: PAS domain-containing protein [Alphaproteobacteria bacterium]|nr:PAS domain-containing protein [Alphaproteobacteria bacterium]MBL7097318.1 PAS domain-containing protein [Alphaproteobacteria bacterium]
MSRIVYFGPDKVTRLIEDPDAVTDQPVLRFFLEYWKAKRVGEHLPLPSSFVPGEVRGNLKWVALIDVVPPEEGDFRYRLVGTCVAEYFLGDGTGKPLREAFAGVDPEFVKGALHVLRHTCALRRPVRLTGPSSRWRKVYFPAYDNLYLPYATDGEHVDRIVNVFTFDRSSLNGRQLLALETVIA